MSTAGLVHPPISSSGAETIARPQTATRAAGVPWYVYLGAVAVTSAALGGRWDVAWHRSIGRDSFLTPAHVMIYACGVLAAVICGYLIFATTFGGSEAMRGRSVSVLGFRAPLGAFLAAWGGIAMITSGPFDNWWHAAYGLDVKIISPPHTLLILGIRAVDVGMLFLTLAALNRETNREAPGMEETATHRQLQRIYLYLSGLIVCGQMFFLMEKTADLNLHAAPAYVSLGIALPLVFAVLSQSSRSRWACTITASIYTILGIAEILIFPLVAATPKLGPVYHPVTHLIPAQFPILIVVPALALDLLWQKTKQWQTWKIALASGIVFIAVLTVVEWPFATFLMSKASENRFFGTTYFGYNARPDSDIVLRRFVDLTGPAQMAKGLLEAALFGACGTWIGLKFGTWMRGVQR